MSMSQKYINYLIENQEPVTVYLKSGTKIERGFISAYDGEALFYTSRGLTDLYFSDSVASVVAVNGIPKEKVSEFIHDND